MSRHEDIHFKKLSRKSINLEFSTTAALCKVIFFLFSQLSISGIQVSDFLDFRYRDVKT